MTQHIWDDDDKEALCGCLLPCDGVSLMDGVYEPGLADRDADGRPLWCFACAVRYLSLRLEELEPEVGHGEPGWFQTGLLSICDLLISKPQVNGDAWREAAVAYLVKRLVTWRKGPLDREEIDGRVRGLVVSAIRHDVSVSAAQVQLDMMSIHIDDRSTLKPADEV